MPIVKNNDTIENVGGIFLGNDISLGNLITTESVCLLVTPEARQHINVGIDSEEYYKLKNS